MRALPPRLTVLLVAALCSCSAPPGGAGGGGGGAANGGGSGGGGAGGLAYAGADAGIPDAGFSGVCDPLAQVGCDAGERCTWHAGGPLACTADGTLGLGAPC